MICCLVVPRFLDGRSARIGADAGLRALHAEDAAAPSMDADIDQAVAKRVRRQAILRDASRTFVIPHHAGNPARALRRQRGDVRTASAPALPHAG